MNTTTAGARASSPWRAEYLYQTDLFARTFLDKVSRMRRDSPCPVQECQSVELFEGKGFQIRANVNISKLGKKGGGKRGIIHTLSAQSRRNLRNWMLWHRPPDGWSTWALSLTIPGEPSDADACSAFLHFTRDYIQKNGCGLLYRLEKQRRGVIHFHCILATPPNEKPCYWKFFMYESWERCVDRLGPLNLWPVNKGNTLYTGRRSDAPGAQRHMFDMQNGGGDARWMRYLQDHTSKHKGEQIAHDVGRHWGVVGRKWWKDVPPGDRLYFENEKSFRRFLRALQRLATPCLNRKPGGVDFPLFNADGWQAKHSGHWRRSLGYRIRRGSRGLSTWFGTCSTARTLANWANEKQISKNGYSEWSKSI